MLIGTAKLNGTSFDFFIDNDAYLNCPHATRSNGNIFVNLHKAAIFLVILINFSFRLMSRTRMCRRNAVTPSHLLKSFRWINLQSLNSTLNCKPTCGVFSRLLQKKISSHEKNLCYARSTTIFNVSSQALKPVGAFLSFKVTVSLNFKLSLLRSRPWLANLAQIIFWARREKETTKTCTTWKEKKFLLWKHPR